MDDLNIYEKIGWAVTWTPCRRLYNRAPCRLVAHGWVECNNRHKLILAGRPTTFGSTIVHCSFVRCRAGEIFVDFTKEQINRGPLLLFSLASLNSSPPSFPTLDNLLIGLRFDFFLRSRKRSDSSGEGFSINFVLPLFLSVFLSCLQCEIRDRCFICVE